MVKCYRLGLSVSNPRVVTEKVFEFNHGLRETDGPMDGDDSDQEEDSIFQRRLSIETFDLKDFFTNVNRQEFGRFVEQYIARIRQDNPGANWF